MKTFKQFLQESLEEDFQKYLIFVSNALYGRNPDKYYKENRKSINHIATTLRENHPPPLKKLYRGILLEDKFVKNNTFDPLHYVTYMSFSEDKKAARIFADPKNPMGDLLMSQNPTAKGYMIEYYPKVKEIMFHWKWSEVLGLNRVPFLDMNLIQRQKEVIIRQTGQKLNLVPFK